MTKEKISVTIDSNILKKVDKQLESRIFRNKSHFVEVAISKYLEE